MSAPAEAVNILQAPFDESVLADPLKETPLSSERGYVLQLDAGSEAESNRLAGLHEAFRAFFGGGLFPGEREKNLNPKRILELGAGSGSWALQAAASFPDSEVFAVDQVLPQSPSKLPPNLKFKKFDLTHPFDEDLNPESFDIVRIQYVLDHLPKGDEILKDIFKLVKPGGWLLVNEGSAGLSDPGGLGPANKYIWEHIQTKMKQNNMDTEMFLKVPYLLLSSGIFSEINIKALPLPVSRWNAFEENDDLHALGKAMWLSYNSVGGALMRSLGSSGSDELLEGYLEELNDPRRNMIQQQLFTWSRKAVSWELEG